MIYDKRHCDENILHLLAVWDIITDRRTTDQLTDSHEGTMGSYNSNNSTKWKEKGCLYVHTIYICMGHVKAKKEITDFSYCKKVKSTI